MLSSGTDGDFARMKDSDGAAKPGSAEVPAGRRKLFQDIADRLAGRILAGELRPGDRLPSERELMRENGTGRPAVREALQTLERAGLISISHGARASVVAPSSQAVIDQIEHSARHLIRASPEHLEHLKQARTFFEEGMARIAAERAGPADVAALREHIATQAAAREDAAFLAADMRFHQRIASISGNPIYAGLSRAVLEWLAEHHVELVRVPGAEALTLVEHGQIVDAIDARDAEAAVRAMREHLGRANTLYRQLDARS